MDMSEPNVVPVKAEPGLRAPVRVADDRPLYNIGVVARMTGVPVATIRVWERRYGFPRSVRTPGGHRIYSEQEVERLRWVKARVDEGMQASQAVQALSYLERKPEAVVHAPAPAEPLPATGSKALAEAQRRFLQVLLRHDLPAADQVLAETLVLFPLETVLLELIRPSLVAIGEGWAAGEVSVATEHLASYYLRQRLLMWMAAAPTPRPVAPLALACAPEDWHETGALMLGVLIGRQRWPMRYLGPALPLPDLARFVEDTSLSAIVLVATTAETAAALADWPRWLPAVRATGRPAFCFGGRGFVEAPALRETVPGHFLGPSFTEALAELNRILSRQAEPPD